MIMASENLSHASPFVLLELEDITPALNQPLANTGRIKYTCFDVSRSLIVLGATSGGIYVFRRTPVEFLQLIPNKEGVITRISISSDEKYISFANGKGIVAVVECSQNASVQPLNLMSKEHQGNEVTAMMWSTDSVLLYIGDDVGKLSILQIPTFMTKTMFHSTAQVIMNLDSRICQIDITHCMLVVSTLTRCYISHTEKEQYRQIGQKLRDGEYGVCFLTCTDHKDDVTVKSKNLEQQQEIQKYQIMTDDDIFSVSDKLLNTSIYCGRPSSRLWEASIDGTVKRTQQYKQVLAKPPSLPFTQTAYQKEVIELTKNSTDNEGQSVNFARLHTLRNCVILSYKKDALFFLNTENVENTIWFDQYKDILDCKVNNNYIFLWHSNGSITLLLFLTIENFLIKCYLDEKYQICAEICLIFSQYLISSNNLSPKLSIIAGLKDKANLDNNTLQKLYPVFEKIASLKTEEATEMNCGIYIVDNTHLAKNFLDEADIKDVKSFAPEAMQTLKDLSNTVTDRFNSSKKKLKEKWDDLEEKIKSMDIPQFDNKPNNTVEIVNRLNKTDLANQEDLNTSSIDLDIKQEILHNSSQPQQIELENNEELDLYKSLFKNYRLYEHKRANESNICQILDEHNCDITEIHKLLQNFEQYCKSIDISEEESKFIANSIFLIYINASTKNNFLSVIIRDPCLYKIFVDACVFVNLKNKKISHLSCECGYPLPYTCESQTPLFSDLIDRFIEIQWTSHTQAQCYEICKKMPYLWRKILFLRRNEDLLNILLLLLQMLDESLLYSFLPQFTRNTWARTIQLYSILSTNVCLNCNKKFENIDVKKTLSWDSLGLLLIKSVGGIDAINVMKEHADLLEVGDLTLKFYHTSFLAAKIEKYDVMIRNQLADTLYRAYDYEDSRTEICRLVWTVLNEDIRNTSLPVIVASKSRHWGLNFTNDNTIAETEDEVAPDAQNITMDRVLECMKSANDCMLCGIPVVNQVLISDGGIWAFKCGHIFHRACLDLLRTKLCPQCISQS